MLAVDNLSGARVAGRIIRVDHVENYKRTRAEVSPVRSTTYCHHGVGLHMHPLEQTISQETASAKFSHPERGACAVTTVPSSLAVQCCRPQEPHPCIVNAALS